MLAGYLGWCGWTMGGHPSVTGKGEVRRHPTLSLRVINSKLSGCSETYHSALAALRNHLKTGFPVIAWKPFNGCLEAEIVSNSMCFNWFRAVGDGSTCEFPSACRTSQQQHTKFFSGHPIRLFRLQHQIPCIKGNAHHAYPEEVTNGQVA